MTKQIVIKLNERKFKPLLDELTACGKGLSKSYSESVKKAVFFCHHFNTYKYPELDNETMLQTILDKMNKTYNQAFLEFLKKYTDFLKK